MSAGIKKYPLGRQPPRARAHRYTTTSACAHRGKVLAQHNLYSRLNALGGKQSSVSAWINILDPAIQIFFRFRAAATLAKSAGGFSVGSQLENLPLRGS